MLRGLFADVRYARHSAAVDLFAGVRREVAGG
jgi:hypothetical protein